MGLHAPQSLFISCGHGRVDRQKQKLGSGLTFCQVPAGSHNKWVSQRRSSEQWSPKSLGLLLSVLNFPIFPRPVIAEGELAISRSQKHLEQDSSVPEREKMRYKDHGSEGGTPWKHKARRAFTTKDSCASVNFDVCSPLHS